ncbi:hypothetical protein V6N11_036257 [Hibiscus sabdariffa]|uniref:Uncharacterized protein n=1 Tax=Hibiscus sabdariffa TaxID=183260 RepID=A0ABR2RAB7_9ROSI
MRGAVKWSDTASIPEELVRKNKQVKYKLHGLSFQQQSNLTDLLHCRRKGRKPKIMDAILSSRGEGRLSLCFTSRRPRPLFRAPELRKKQPMPFCQLASSTTPEPELKRDGASKAIHYSLRLQSIRVNK